MHHRVPLTQSMYFSALVYFILSKQVQHCMRWLCMCFLFSDDEFSATALLSEESRIKNTYTDGTKFYACIIKYTYPRRYRIFAGDHTGSPLQTLSQICAHCKNISSRNSAHNQCEHKSKTVRQESMTSRRSLLRVESTPSKDVYVFFIQTRQLLINFV